MLTEAQSSRADVWYLKDIVFRSRHLKIITQNFNGPCSFIAICNVLVLRGHIEILPTGRTTASYEFLSQLVGEYLLTNCPDIDISAALSILPSTTKGLDLNPQFTSITAFSPTSDAGELALFAQAGIQLVHGWVVDPESPEAEVMTQIRDYDSAVTLIANADYITKGRLLSGDGGADDPEGRTRKEPEAGQSGSAVADTATFLARQNTSQYSDEDRRKIEQAIVARQFLDATGSQLTYHGLFQLASSLEPDSLATLFRNAHLSVVYKSPDSSPAPGSTQPQLSAGPDASPNVVCNRSAEPESESESNTNPQPETNDATPDRPHRTPSPSPVPASTSPAPLPILADSALYALVTDEAFLHEPTIVWERLEDVDGGSSWFVDAHFRRAVPVGGDVAGQTAEGTLRRLEMETGLRGVVDPADQALARRMQAEEDEHAREVYMKRQQALARRRVAAAAEEERRRADRAPERGSKKSKNCLIM